MLLPCGYDRRFKFLFTTFGQFDVVRFGRSSPQSLLFLLVGQKYTFSSCHPILPRSDFALQEVVLLITEVVLHLCSRSIRTLEHDNDL